MEQLIRAYIAQLRQELREEIRQEVRQQRANSLIPTTIAKASEGGDNSDALTHSANLWGTQDGETTSNAQRGEIARPDARSIEPPGHATVPRDDDPCVVLGIGSNLLVIPLASTRWRPAGLKQSEAAVYNLAGASGQGVVKIDKDGQITATRNGATIKIDKDGQITIDAAAGKDVIVNGGTAKVARVDDQVNLGGLSVTIGAGAVTSVQWSPPTGGAPITVATSPAITPLTGLVKTGADRFKG